MRNVQFMKKKIYIYIPCVPHINNDKKNWFTRHETDRFLNNHCQECVRARAYLSIHDCLSFLHEVMIGNQSEQNNRKLISLHNNGEDDKHAHGFADF
jgi:glutaredoxin-related protein